MKTAVVIGAGPAGLTAAHELIKQSGDWKVVVCEETGEIGGPEQHLARTGPPCAEMDPFLSGRPQKVGVGHASGLLHEHRHGVVGRNAE